MFFQKVVLQSFCSLHRGSLTVELPDGTTETFGGLRSDLRARLTVRHPEFFKRCVLFGAIGFAESFIAGEWETPDLTVLLAWFILNAEDSAALKTHNGRPSLGLNLLNAWNRLLHERRPNSLLTSRRNIQEHYDLSNEFFALWLDPTMTYSSALFTSPTLTLQQAQIQKYDRLCLQLHLKASDHLLEIGSGWGGMSLHAASTYGCRVTTLTISQKQFDEASRRIAEAGLTDRVTILLRDYREMKGTFDKIVSIEMLEAVGDHYVDGYFACCDRLLKPHGLLGLQAILSPDQQYPILRDGVDFIQKHIFPGSLLMSNARIAQAMGRAGSFNLLDYHDMAPHYARTLRTWRENFLAQKDKVLALGFDEAFARKWLYYLCYCEAAFGARHITVAQMIYSRPDNTSLHSPVYRLLPSVS